MAPGSHFQMDMGFVRGAQFSYKDADGRLIISLYGCNSYLIIIDQATRYTWTFLAKTKLPQIDNIKQFLAIHGSTVTTQHRIRTDKGGELQFQQLVKEAGYILEPTASDASFQNGITERQNCTSGDMMRSMLRGANLVLIYAVYIKNRLPHHSIGQIPFQAYTGKRPDLKHLRIFGSLVVARMLGHRLAKLDDHTSSGIFLGFTATPHNIYYKDNPTCHIKTATHISYEQADYTLPPSQLSSVQRNLQQNGMVGSPNTIPSTITFTTSLDSSQDHLQVRLLSPRARMPSRGTKDSAGLDLYSTADVSIPPRIPTKVPTDLAICPQEGTYCQVLTRSGLLLNHQIEAKAGVID